MLKSVRDGWCVCVVYERKFKDVVHFGYLVLFQENTLPMLLLIFQEGVDCLVARDKQTKDWESCHRPAGETPPLKEVIRDFPGTSSRPTGQSSLFLPGAILPVPTLPASNSPAVI